MATAPASCKTAGTPAANAATAQDITTQRALLWPLFYTGVFYLLFNGGLTLLFGWAEKKLNYYKG